MVPYPKILNGITMGRVRGPDKVIVVDIHDPLAPKLNDIEDVERHLPGLIRATNEWFR